MRRSSAWVVVVVLTLFSSVIAAPVTASSAPAKLAPDPSVVRDVQAAIHEMKVEPPQQADTTTEPSISVNPENPLNVVAVYQAGRIDAGCAQTNGYAVTFDGGKTWDYGPFPKLTTANGGTYPKASDPVVAFGPDNVVYMNHLMCSGGTENDLAFSVSKNGGKTWGKPIMVPVERTLPLDDKNWITVDNSDAFGHHKGRLYLVWDNVAPVVAMYSDDGAQTWNGPFVIYPGQGIGTVPLVMPNGDLAVVYNTLASAQPAVHQDPYSTDPQNVRTLSKQIISVAHGAGLVPTGGPLVFAPPTTVDAWRGRDARQQRAAEDLPTAAVDPKSGRIYVAWGDNRFREDIVNDIVITHSDDGGLTWSGVRRVNPGKKNDHLEHFTPAIEVGKDGIVRVSYRTQQQNASANILEFSPFVDTYYQQSSDEGKTFSSPLRLNRGFRSDVRFATYSRNSAFYGDYSQIAVTGSWAYVVRCESFRLHANEPASFPPKVHHQRVFVAVVDADGDGKI